MPDFLTMIFIFFVGSCLGWIIELIFRRMVGKRWINPGFLVGPYLPIYGFGLCSLVVIYTNLYKLGLFPIITIILMGLAMTLIELIGGLVFVKGAGIKLWDYSNRWGNYKGIICPIFTFYWTILSTIFYYLIAGNILSWMDWFSNHLAFSFVLGMFFAVIIIDLCYSTKILVSIRKFAKNNQVTIRYEELKKDIKELKENLKERTSFIFSFNQTGNLFKYLERYRDKFIKTKDR